MMQSELVPEWQVGAGSELGFHKSYDDIGKKSDYSKTLHLRVQNYS